MWKRRIALSLIAWVASIKKFIPKNAAECQIHEQRCLFFVIFHLCEISLLTNEVSKTIGSEQSKKLNKNTQI